MGQLYRPSLDRRPKDEYPMPPCTKVNPEIFIQHRFLKVAQAVCGSCPFKRTCLEAVLACDRDPGGVYAGHTEASRNRIRENLSCRPVGN